MSLLLLATGLLQGLQVSGEVDRDRIGIGDAVTYTIRTMVTPGDPVIVTLPPFDGFTVIGRTERREPAGAGEVHVLELRLRSLRAGIWRVGSVRVAQGLAVAVSPEVEVAVEAGRTAAPPLGPRVRRLLQRAPPPPAGEVGVTLLVSADTVLVGEQVDVVTTAWFPRELLGRLRRPPSIRPPTVDGVYSAVQPSAAGVASSLMVGEVWYDLYVAHQVIFPVAEGTVTIPAAGLAYSLPTGRQYFSDEKAYDLLSRARTLVVRALPPGGAGPVVRDLAIDYELSPEAARVGDPIDVNVVLSGSGNLALWPAPVVRWPDGSRGYAEDVEDATRRTEGLVGGDKRFRFAVIVDSAGSLALPDIRYPYFDPERGAWREVVAHSVVLPVQPARPMTRPRVTLPSLASEPIGFQTMSSALGGLVALLLLLPPAIVMALRRRLGPRRNPAGQGQGDPLAEFTARVHELVPDPDHRRPERLAQALREAGLDAGMSGAAAEHYRRAATLRFDPDRRGEGSHLEEGAASLLRRWPRRVQAGMTIAILMLVGTGPSAAQGPAPTTARAWYAAGAEAWQTGQDARAAAAWVNARRLAPRDRTVTAAWRLVANRSGDLQRVGTVLPLTPAELLLMAALLWAGTWVANATRRRRLVWGLAVVTATAFVLAWVQHRANARPEALLSRSAVLREAPHGLAGETGRGEELAVVALVAHRPGWTLVRAAGRVQGWLPDAVLVPIRPLDSGP
jgi:hypothetical protein